MLNAEGICPAVAARTEEPSYSDFERESTIMTALLFLLFFIANFICLKSASILRLGLFLKLVWTNALLFVSISYPSFFHLSNPPSIIATLLCEKYSNSQTPLAADGPEISS